MNETLQDAHEERVDQLEGSPEAVFEAAVMDFLDPRYTISGAERDVFHDERIIERSLAAVGKIRDYLKDPAAFVPELSDEEMAELRARAKAELRALRLAIGPIRERAFRENNPGGLNRIAERAVALTWHDYLAEAKAMLRGGANEEQVREALRARRAAEREGRAARS